MNKQLLNIRSVKAYATALFCSLVLLGTSAKAIASDKSKNENEAVITYVGQADNGLIGFNVTYNNVDEESFWLKLTDNSGHILYQKRFSDKDFNKNIYLRNIGDNARVHFSIKSAKNTITQKFDIGTETKMIQEIVVTKL